MPYLNLDPNFSSHPKAMRLNGRLGANSHLLMINLWCFAAKFHPRDGDLSIYSIAEIESFAAWAGDKQCFYNACVEVGFIDVKKDGKSITLHDWKDHQGHLEALKLRAQKAAKVRWNKIHRNSQKGQAHKLQEDKCNATSTAKKEQAMLDECSFPSIPSSPSVPSSPSEIIKEVKPPSGDTSEKLLAGETRIGGRNVLQEELQTLAERVQVLPYVETEKQAYVIAGWIVKEGCDGDIPVALELLHQKANYLVGLKDSRALYKVLRTVFKDPEQMGKIESDAHKQI